MSPSNFKFSHPASQTRGILPPNTGTSDDWNFDKAIGRDSEKRWQMYNRQRARKDQVIRENPGATYWDITKTPDGDFAVMKPEERETVAKAFQTFRDVENAAQVSEGEPSKKAG